MHLLEFLSAKGTNVPTGAKIMAASRGWGDDLSESRANFAKHAANLWAIKQLIQKLLATDLGAFSNSLHLADGFPIPVGHFRRANFSEVFAGEATDGYCASKGESYYGFKGNLLVNADGVITGITVTQANIDERESLWDLVEGVHGMIIADKGLIGAAYQNELREFTGIDLQTAARSNMEEQRSKKFLKWLTSTRRLVETVIGQLTERFNIEKVRARKMWYLTNRITKRLFPIQFVLILIKNWQSNASI